MYIYIYIYLYMFILYFSYNVIKIKHLKLRHKWPPDSHIFHCIDVENNGCYYAVTGPSAISFVHDRVFTEVFIGPRPCCYEYSPVFQYANAIYLFLCCQEMWRIIAWHSLTHFNKSALYISQSSELFQFCNIHLLNIFLSNSSFYNSSLYIWCIKLDMELLKFHHG